MKNSEHQKATSLRIATRYTSFLILKRAIALPSIFIISPYLISNLDFLHKKSKMVVEDFVVFIENPTFTLFVKKVLVTYIDINYQLYLFYYTI